VLCVCLQELVADQQLSRAAVKQSSVAGASSSSYEPQSVTDSPHKPPATPLDQLSQLPTTVATAGGDISSQQL